MATLKTELDIIESGTITIEDSLKGKTKEDKVFIKSSEIVRLTTLGKETIDSIEVDFISVSKIDTGVVVLVRAWDGGNPIGFGKDGTVEIERFIIHNPPVLIEDPLGSINRDWIDDQTGTNQLNRFREDPEAAIRKVILENIQLVGKDGKNIIPGKVGNTTSTFYPDPDPETTSVDGYMVHSTGSGWATARAATTSTTTDDTIAAQVVIQSEATANGIVSRNPFLFDTSSLGSDTIDSGTFSLYSQGSGNNTESTNPADLALVSSSPASDTGLVSSDFNISNWGSTLYASVYDLGTFIGSTGYKNMTLNASGEAFINGSGITKFGIRGKNDVDNNAPTARSYGLGYYADETGTTKDPKLVIEHTAGAAAFTPRVMVY